MPSTPLKPALARLRLRHLQLLELLQEVGTARKAAERLHLSHPAVSQMLREIEEAFGGQLFERSRRGVAPNARLQLLLRRTRAMLGEAQAAERELQAAPSPLIRLGANFHLLTHLMPDAIRRLRGQHPGLRLSLHEGSVDNMLESLAAGGLDCVIGRLSAGYARDSRARELKFWTLYKGRHCVVAGLDHPLAKKRRLTLADLAGEDWALSHADGQSRDVLNRSFLLAGLPPPQPVIECRPYYVNLSFVTGTRLVTVAMESEARRAQAAGLIRILPVSLDADFAPNAFLCRRSTEDDPWVSTVRAAVMESARRLAAAT
jgi:DNA-binding transcriptional LysR family regulator